MFRIVRTLAFVLGVVSFAAAPAIEVEIRSNRADALFGVQEQANLRVTVTEGGTPVTEGTVAVQVSRDGGESLGHRVLDLGAEGGAAFVLGLDRPGFARVEAVYNRDGRNYRGLAAFGFDPGKIEATTVDPEDFDRFWRTARERLAEIPLDARVTRLEQYSGVNVDCYAVSFANVDDTRIYGFLSVPRGREAPFPAYVTVPGAGPGPTAPSAHWATRGALSLVMGVHAYDVATLGKEGIDAAYKELNAGGSYSHIGKGDREGYYFYRAILGVDRAIGWLMSRPDWDGSHLVVDGSSQGGAFALIMAGLNPRVTAAAANVPAMCEHSADLAGRQPGWPNLVGRLEGQARDEVLAMSAYYDVVNFARRIKCPVIVSAGFVDRTCPPGTVYAAFNQIQAPKRMFDGPLDGHHWQVGEYRAFHERWLAGRLGLGQPCEPGD